MSTHRTIATIAANPHARRELLWLQAKEKDEHDVVADLEEVDPAIRARLEAAGLDVADYADETPERRQQRFRQQFEARYDFHAATLTSRKT